MAQTVHAALEFGIQNPSICKSWHEDSNYLVCLATKDQEQLLALLTKAKDNGIKHLAYTEPDFGGAVTAIAFEPGELTRKLLSSIGLALKEKRIE